MKCELCHKADASEALVRDGETDDELYVCAACAKAEKVRRQRQSQRTRKNAEAVEGLEEAPQVVRDFVEAIKDFVGDIEMSVREVRAMREAEPDLNEIPAARAPAAFRIKGGFHLEGLHLIGEIDAVKRALHALDMDLIGICADGVNDSGHVYRLVYRGNQSERAKRVVQDILREEKNARTRLRREEPRIFTDAICRALALLKNCRLLSSGEYFDLLSPLRLAAREKLLDGITVTEIERLMNQQDLTNSADRLPQPERDQADSVRADAVNQRFEEVLLDDVF